MSDDTRQARIAAAEQAIDDAIWRLMGTRMSITGENLYQQVATAAIDAADAVAAPAVGVSNRVTANELVVAYGKAAIAWSKDTSNQSLGDAMDAAKHRVIDALLTAQPEPGTHGNGCPACDGKGWVEEKCLVCFGDGFDDGDEPGTHDAGQPAEGGE